MRSPVAFMQHNRGGEVNERRTGRVGWTIFFFPPVSFKSAAQDSSGLAFKCVRLNERSQG